MSDPEGPVCADCPQLEVEASGAVCTLRALPVRLPGETYCANQPSFGGPATRVPVGPVLLRGEEGTDVVADSPDDRSVRDGLINLVRDSGASRVEQMTPQEETALWQLQAWNERRAYVLLENIIGEPRLPGEPERAVPTAAASGSSRKARPFKPIARRARVTQVLLGIQVGVLLLTPVLRLVGTTLPVAGVAPVGVILGGAG